MKNSNKVLIDVQNLSKTFKILGNRKYTVRSLFSNFFSQGKKTEYAALKNISFEIRQGEFVSIIGRNGSGKSTLLKLLAGIYSPDKGGKIETKGTIVPFLELGVGFNPELSGRENIFLNGVILGMNKRFLQSKFDEIVSFAELEKFIDTPLKNYSSGMMVRLAFSIAVQAKADIYLLDEVLGVGDLSFQRKSERKMKDLMASGATIVYVSHSLEKVKELSSKAIYLRNGKIEAMGDASTVSLKYQEIVGEEDTKKKQREEEEYFRAKGIKKEGMDNGKLRIKTTTTLSIADIDEISFRYGNGNIEIEKVKFMDHTDTETLSLESGKKFSCEVLLKVNVDTPNIAVSLSFRKEPKSNLFGLHTFFPDKLEIKNLKKGDTKKITFTSEMPLAEGQYYATVGVAEFTDPLNYISLDVLNNYFDISVYQKDPIFGFIQPPKSTSIEIE